MYRQKNTQKLKLGLSAIAALMMTCVALPAQARPISYPGGWTVMSMNDVDMNALHFFYTPSPRYSWGLSHEYLRESKANMTAVQGNYLIKRWNLPEAQANLYFKGGAGVAYGSGDQEPAVYGGVAADWENRRLYTSYENHFIWAGDVHKSAAHTARVGVAPYIGDYGDLHTWLMLQTDYDAGDKDSFSVTPLVRMFKGTTLVEAGYNLDDGILFNLMMTY